MSTPGTMDTLHHVLPSPSDPEKGLEADTINVSSPGSSTLIPTDLTPLPPPLPLLRPVPLPKVVTNWNRWISSLRGLEARGITRVLPEERKEPSRWDCMQMGVLWFSANISANNLAVGLLGPLLFQLGFLDSALIATFACLLGSLGPAYMSIWGAQSGNRTMIVARYFMGYWPSKLTTVLNIIIMIGYNVISCILGGQILSAVSGGSMSIVVGIVITAIMSWSVAVFGMTPFHVYERWAWIAQCIVLFILVGSAGPHFDSSLKSVGNPATIAANRLSFFSLQLSVPLSWAGAASDFFVYFPEKMSKWKIFLMTATGLTISFVFVNLLGVGLASGIVSNPAWSDAYHISSGALILAGYGGLGGFGRFCAVVITLGLGSNIIPSTYAAALDFQVLGRVWKGVPRYAWVTVTAIIYLVCAVAGRDHLFLIFQNFLALMGYWLAIFITIVLEEHTIFRRHVGFDWTAWEDKKRLPVGIAALIAFLIGWVGPIVGMYQVWWTGPVARKLGDHGGDLGIWLGIVFSGVTYPPLRYLELKKIGR